MYLAVFFRNFQAGGLCHVGLGVNALQTGMVLRRRGVRVDVFGLPEPEDVLKKLRELPETPTHVVIEAVWIDIPTLKRLVTEFPMTDFAVRAHSQVGFLQVEPPAVRMIREMLELSKTYPNLTVSANSDRLAHFLRTAYDAPCVYLPNLYDLEYKKNPTEHDPNVLRIASFGALRLLKNHMTSAAAALLIAKHENKKVEFWLSVNREENSGAKGILSAIRNLYSGLDYAKLVEHPWERWGAFRKTIGSMDLYLQVSFTETFNITVADAIAEGVPSVVSDAINWAPTDWIAEADSVEDITNVGLRLLHDPQAPHHGLKALEHYMHRSVGTWLHYLGVHAPAQ